MGHIRRPAPRLPAPVAAARAAGPSTYGLKPDPGLRTGSQVPCREREGFFTMGEEGDRVVCCRAELD
jgi:hypothetical protein